MHDGPLRSFAEDLAAYREELGNGFASEQEAVSTSPGVNSNLSAEQRIASWEREHERKTRSLAAYKDGLAGLSGSKHSTDNRDAIVILEVRAVMLRFDSGTVSLRVIDGPQLPGGFAVAPRDPQAELLEILHTQGIKLAAGQPPHIDHVVFNGEGTLAVYRCVPDPSDAEADRHNDQDWVELGSGEAMLIDPYHAEAVSRVLESIAMEAGL